MNFITKEDILSGGKAIFSACLQYRYELRRVWDTRLPPLVMILLNPSTATEIENDPTITRCIQRARSIGRGSLIVLNAFAFRATEPDDMMATSKPVGPENDAFIYRGLSECQRAEGTAVIGWGAHGAWKGRDRQIIEMGRQLRMPLYCLGFTKAGQPRHPLYVLAKEELTAYARPTAEGYLISPRAPEGLRGIISA